METSTEQQRIEVCHQILFTTIHIDGFWKINVTAILP